MKHSLGKQNMKKKALMLQAKEAFLLFTFFPQQNLAR